MENEETTLSLTSINQIEEELKISLISIKTKKHKSLGLLTLFFMQLFFQRNMIVSLEEAALSIFDQDGNGQVVFKSKVILKRFIIVDKKVV